MRYGHRAARRRTAPAGSEPRAGFGARGHLGCHRSRLPSAFESASGVRRGGHRVNRPRLRAVYWAGPGIPRYGCRWAPGARRSGAPVAVHWDRKNGRACRQEKRHRRPTVRDRRRPALGGQRRGAGCHRRTRRPHAGPGLIAPDEIDRLAENAGGTGTSPLAKELCAARRGRPLFSCALVVVGSQIRVGFGRLAVGR